MIRPSRRELLRLAASVTGSVLLGRAARAESPRTRHRIYLQPLGSATPEAEVLLVETALLAFYDVALERLAAIPLPRASYYPPRGRYRAERLLDFLEGQRPEDGYRVLGVTGVDISTTKEPHQDWGVLGLASLDGRTCVLSSYRCRRGARSAEHARIRFAKTAVHELGHTFGLPHCETRGCLMEDGQGTVLTTDREYDLCAVSRARLVRAGYSLASGRAIPWPEPGGV